MRFPTTPATCYAVMVIRFAGGMVLLATCVGFWVPQAAAHDLEHHKIAADKFSLTGAPDRPEKNGVSFKSKKQLSINGFVPDPTASVTSLRVRTFGATDADSGFVRLDRARWRTAGSAGWRYKGVRGVPSDRGVRKILLKLGPAGGRLVVRAKGELWPVSVEGAIDAVELALVVGSHTVCAEASSATSADFVRNEAGRVRARAAEPPLDCVAMCGNAIVEVGEACDDGNDVDDDTCSDACEACPSSATDFDSTFEALQALVFDEDAHLCSTAPCHGAAESGQLTLTAGQSYGELIGIGSTADPQTLRVFPGDEDRSLLYLKLASRVFGVPSAANLPGSPMPVGGTELSAEKLEALRLWIRAGAPADGVVAGTPEMLDSCLPAPTPAEVPAPYAPVFGEGFQLAMPGWLLAAGTETELCVATYYDLTAPGLVPESAKVPCPGAFPGTNDSGPDAGLCLSYDRQLIVQDTHAHHLNVFAYTGAFDYDDEGWGNWSCYGGAEDGANCDPAVTVDCPGGVCGSETSGGGLCGPPSFGPADLGAGGAAGFIGVRFLGAALEPVAETTYPEDVYATLPLRGLVVWDSHAFNAAGSATSMNAWVNHEYAANRVHVVEPAFSTDYLYTQDVPPFEQREYCVTHTLEEGTRAFSFRSHYHKRGKRFRVWAPPQTPCASGGPAPNGIGLSADSACAPGSPSQLFYESFANDDPLHLEPEPPMHFTGSVEDRTIKYCALFDNGATVATEVKRVSTSVLPFSPLEPGGPCSVSAVKCLGGANVGALCFGDDAACPGSVCDACNLLGGVTTDDEMFGLEMYIFDSD